MPSELRDLIARLTTLLLTGEHPTLAILRRQHEVARLEAVTLSGTGFFADFAVPQDAPRTDPRDLTGGQVNIRLSGVEHGASSLLFVRDGHLATLEGYTSAGERWPEIPEVEALELILAIIPPPA